MAVDKKHSQVRCFNCGVKTKKFSNDETLENKMIKRKWKKSDNKFFCP
jgi:hypothetical protein